MDMQKVSEMYLAQVAAMLDIVASLDEEDHKDSFTQKIEEEQ